MPGDHGDLDVHAIDWIGPDEGMAYRALTRSMAERGPEERCRYRVDTVLGMFAAVRDGAGLAVRPYSISSSSSVRRATFSAMTGSRPPRRMEFPAYSVRWSIGGGSSQSSSAIWPL